MNRRLSAIVLLMLLVVSACAKSNEPTASKPKASAGMGHEAEMVKCDPTGTPINLQAKNVEFDTDCIAVAADTAFKIEFDNADSGVDHNVAIFKGDAASDKLFVGDIITGPKTVTYEVPALKKGSYHFHCDVHPDMNGTVNVK